MEIEDVALSGFITPKETQNLQAFINSDKNSTFH